MKNKKLFAAGMPALALVFAMIAAGCSNPASSDPDPESGGGKLTISNLPAGLTAQLTVSDYSGSLTTAAESTAFGGATVEIAAPTGYHNPTPVLLTSPVSLAGYDGVDAAGPFTRSGTFAVTIYSDSPIVWRQYGQVVFTNGNAAIDYAHRYWDKDTTRYVP